MMTVLAALVCFAANSLLCRYALGEGLIDAATFTTVRLVAGAVILTVLMRPRGRPRAAPAVALSTSAASFSLAYDEVTAATGALLLFGAVQATMLVGATMSGERLTRRRWVGFGTALCGLLYLSFPGLEAPPLVGASLMLLAGVAWGVYSLQGPGVSVAYDFVLAVPLALMVNLTLVAEAHASAAGVLVGLISGAVASGLGYAIWFQALKTLTKSAAATAQLSVPVLAAVGGAWLLSEPLTPRVVVASAVVLFGIALTLPAPPRWRVQWHDVVARVAPSRVRS